MRTRTRPVANGRISSEWIFSTSEGAPNLWNLVDWMTGALMGALLYESATIFRSIFRNTKFFLFSSCSFAGNELIDNRGKAIIKKFELILIDSGLGRNT
jgi:hypothetical protein